MMKNRVQLHRRVATAIVVAGAVAIGAAPSAAAQPISQNTIKRECGQANGTYQWWGSGVSTCTYTDMGGTMYRDYYVDGVYTRTD